MSGQMVILLSGDRYYSGAVPLSRLPNAAGTSRQRLMRSDAEDFFLLTGHKVTHARPLVTPNNAPPKISKGMIACTAKGTAPGTHLIL